MNTKILYGILAAIVIIIVSSVIYAQSNQTQAPGINLQNDNEVLIDETSAPEVAIENSVGSSESVADITDESTMEDIEAKIFEVEFDGESYLPNSIKIRTGDIVVFKNNSNKAFWPASGPHPDHTNYPEFDAKTALAAGKLFQFKFIKPGKWSFHDHLSPNIGGTIVVE